ncbi:TPA: CocE/NonD family hydrolase [Kluyvera ascorbata]|uniref:X-Pro dipeptidyl-peptidase n=1 Tax=Kluyvera genomosp. 2 TaxID=2774054 RepID=A0A2T2Y667_9ENTR|nr:CocE/NonD family hydrolase [Kluyvera genomosp. 2]PSR48032.1 X-Pro dipeptidyl-peptidase [Kluyvera genomosp. 2]HAT3917333.1 CocE/NonD family hydrolase [Kluyvera ascorbata]HAT3942246.1 CocE/NonD family hydrolase [Kluyvera ascorbata]HAT3946610.1 CocE/NonD family hydrolase [Kluyvera ascorbata]
MIVLKDLRVPMRDGVHLAADAYHAEGDEPRPALIALSPYGKELQALALTIPPQKRPSPLWDGCIEAGDITRVVKEGYVHVIGDVRGSGASEGEHIGNYNAGGVPLGQDAYDFIEWVAAQPWCNGCVGMIGISYFGSMQVFAASERPPSLKAIFVSGGHFDFYETTYHGGIMWLMPRAAREGRGGDSGWAFTHRHKSRMLETYTPEEIKARVAARLADPDVAAWPNMVHILHYPIHHESWFDIITNEVDGEWYEEQNPINLAKNIDIPVYLQINQGRGWTVDGTIALFDLLQCPKKLEIGPYPPMQTRPWVDEHDTMFRWYDYWLKGIDNGIMDEPAVKVHVEGTRRWSTGEQWPVKAVGYQPLYLRTRGKLSPEPEAYGADISYPEGFFQAPLTITDKVEKLTWSTDPFDAVTSVHGVGAAHLFVEIDQPDTNLILRLWDEAPSGKRQLVSTGFLKASHRELDARTTEGNPHHPHTRSVPVEPGTINEYVVRIYPFANDFCIGHKLVVELMCNEPMVDEHNSLLPPDAYHLPVGQPVTHIIYRDAAHPSRLVLPFVAQPKANHRPHDSVVNEYHLLRK